MYGSAFDISALFVIDNGRVRRQYTNLQREDSPVSYRSIARLRNELNYTAHYISVCLVDYVI